MSDLTVSLCGWLKGTAGMLIPRKGLMIYTGFTQIINPKDGFRPHFGMKLFGEYYDLDMIIRSHNRLYIINIYQRDGSKCDEDYLVDDGKIKHIVPDSVDVDHEEMCDLVVDDDLSFLLEHFDIVEDPSVFSDLLQRYDQLLDKKRNEYDHMPWHELVSMEQQLDAEAENLIMQLQ